MTAPPTPRRATQRQIADRLGLSPATVSLAMRDSPMIASVTRVLVQQAMREAGYVPNAVGASLRTGRSCIVGVSFHNIAHQFFAEMLIAIDAALTEQGVAVFINNHSENPESLAHFVDTLAGYGADGLIVSPPPHVTQEVFKPLRDRNTPVVYISRFIRGDDSADRVVNADHDAMRRATRRLIDLGHRAIALIGGQPGTSVAEDRVAGFRSELEDALLSWSDELWIQARPRLAEGAAAVDAVLARDPRPTGLVCFNDLVAFGVMSAVRRHGLEPGRDIAVMALGGTGESAVFHPGLTTVLDNPGKIGRRAALILHDRLATPDAAPQHVTLEPKLVIRESCGWPVARA